MALIKCPECGKDVSDTSSICIHCGYKLNQESNDVEKVQQVEVTSIKIDSKPIKKIIIALGIFLALCLVSFYFYTLYQNKNIEKSKDAYLENMGKLSFTGISGAAEAESLANLTKSVWSNCIYEKSDSTTDKYTKSGNRYFHDDFNTALKNLFDDATTKAKIINIETNQDSIKTIFKSLKDYPSGYEEYYTICSEFYDQYLSLTNLAINPTGTLSSFSENLNTIDTDCITTYRKLTDAIEELSPDK